MDRKILGRIDPQIIEDLWHGSIDMHVHPGPDPLAERPLDSGKMALLAKESGMGGLVLKSFTHPTASEAYIIRKNLVGDYPVFGSVVISYAGSGGLEYAAETIEANGPIGAKMVWFPTMDAEYCREYLKREGGICILDDNGNLKPEVYKILEVIKKYDMVVASGHMSYEESTKMFDAAIEMGIDKMVATHPLAELSRFTMPQIMELADKGVYIEHVYGTLMPRLGGMSPFEYVDCLKAVGAERTILGTDLAQVWDPTPADGMRLCIATMLQFGCTPEEVRLAVQTNPAKLLGLQ